MEEGVPLSLIPFRDPCLYQQDGYCSLTRAVSMGSPGKACIHFLPRSSLQKNSQRFPNVLHRDQL